ncbi:hypothetical protein Tco_0827325 [Tanacetum coccineum]
MLGDDVERLWHELAKLETSMEVLEGFACRLETALSFCLPHLSFPDLACPLHFFFEHFGCFLECDDDEDDDDDVEEDEDEEEEEEHPALADSVPPLVHRIPSPPLPVLPPLPVSPPPLPASPTYPLGFRAAMIRQRAESPSTSHSLPLPPPIILSHTRASMAMIRAAALSTYILAPRLGILPSKTPLSGTPPLLPIPLPTPSPPLILPLTNRPRYEVGKSSSAPTARPTGGFRADYGFVATLDDEITRNPERYVGYGITDTWDDMVEDIQGTPAVTDVAGLSKSSEDYCIGTADKDCSLASSRPRSIGTACRDTETDEYTGDTENGTKKNHQSQPHRYHCHTFVTNVQLKAMINQGVTDALAARDAHRNTNGDDSHNSGTGVRRTERVARECTYPDFMKCQPLNFKGTEGVVELIQWLEKMETVFSISNCFVENQIKFSTSTLLAGALTWWNSHVRTVGHDVAYAMTWYLSKATNPLQAKELLQIKEMADQDTPPPTITAMKIPIIKKGEYDIWSMRMRQYICHTDHNMWDIIVNGDLEDEATPLGEQSGPLVPKTAKQLAARRNQERVKSILLLAIPDEYLLKFHNVPDAKSLWAAIKSRFGGNEESKKMQKNVLKHHFENFFTASVSLNYIKSNKNVIGLRKSK